MARGRPLCPSSRALPFVVARSCPALYRPPYLVPVPCCSPASDCPRLPVLYGAPSRDCPRAPALCCSPALDRPLLLTHNKTIPHAKVNSRTRRLCKYHPKCGFAPTPPTPTQHHHTHTPARRTNDSSLGDWITRSFALHLWFFLTDRRYEPLRVMNGISTTEFCFEQFSIK